jgi:hypothetical protein
MANVTTSSSTPATSSASTSSSSSGGVKGAGNFLKSSYMNLPPATRGLVTVVGVGIGLFVIYKIYKQIQQTTSGIVTPDVAAKQEDRGWSRDIDKLNQNPATRATITKAQAASFASSIHAAMDGYGTDEDAINDIFRHLKNDADFAEVANAYGTREVSSGAWNPEPNFNGSMSAALTSEMSTDEKKVANKILADKKITYRI